MAELGEGQLYAVGDKVFVPHNDQRHYEAKVLKAEFRQGDAKQPAGWYFFLHYNGWNKKYDEWVPGNILYKAPAQSPVDASGAFKVPKKAQTSKFGKKKVVGELPVGGEAGLAGPALQLELDVPTVLKKALLEDYDAIVSDTKLTPLPRSPTIIELLKEYVVTAQRLRGSSEVEEELAHGLRTYFDKSLMAVLLYRSERVQALTTLTDGRLPSAVYGAEHLLRLLVKLPELLPTQGMSEMQLGTLAAKLQDFLAWLASHADTFILSKDKYWEPEPLTA